MDIDDYLNQLEQDIELRNQEIDEQRKKTDEILMRIQEQSKIKEQEIMVTDTQQSQDEQKQVSQSQIRTKQINQNQQQLNNLAAQMAEKGVEQEVVKNLGQDAELVYLQTRNKNLERIINQQTADQQKILQQQQELKENCNIYQAQRDKLQKQVTLQQGKINQLNSQNEQLQNKISTLQAELAAIQQKTEKTSKIAQQGVLSNQTKEKQISRLIDQVEVLKKQINNFQEREVLMRQKMEQGEDMQNQQNKRLQRENDELLNIIKKQQQLIDVLQRQKLHLQGAIQLGFTEEEFQKILDK